MKQFKKFQNQLSSKIIKVLFSAVLLCISYTSKGQCTASFMPFDSVGYGYFYNTSTGSGLTSTWSFGDGTSGTSVGDITHLYATPGTYYVCLTVNNFITSCTATFCDSITILSSTVSCNAYFVSNDSSSFTQFYDYSTGTGMYNYFWDFGDGSTSSTVGNETHLYTSPGTYTVCLTITDTTTSCTDTYCSSVTVPSVSTCNASFIVVQDSTNLFNYFVYNTSSSLAPALSYLWDFGDGTTSTGAYPSHTYSSTTPVVLCLTIADGTGCSDTFCDSITPGMMMSSTFTINVLPLVGITEEVSIISALENYPNPLSDVTTISYSIKKDTRVELAIFDLLGNKIASIENGNKQTGKFTTTWNSDGVVNGMYLLQLKAGNSVSVKKLVISK
jgi:PKD repeat protein